VRGSNCVLTLSNGLDPPKGYRVRSVRWKHELCSGEGGDASFLLENC
jgi:hypothetical protein